MDKSIEELEYERKVEIYNDFMPIWNDERKIQLEAEGRFNKNLFALAAGSFGISFAFISQIVPLECAKQSVFIVVAWLLMGITLILNILDSRITYWIQDKILNNIDMNIERGYEGKPYLDSDKRLIMLPTRILKWIMLASFSAGIFALLYFVYVNIRI